MMDEMNEKVEKVLYNQLPVYFRPIIEFQEIMKVHGYSLEELKRAVIRIQDNFCIVSCDRQTLAWYEALLGITKTKGLSLEERRLVVLMQYSMRFLYTLPALKEMLASAVGTDKYSVECLYESYQMIVKIIGQDTALVRELYNMIALTKPAHIELLLYAEYRELVKVEVKNALSITFITAFYPRFNVPVLLLDDTWLLDGSQVLSGYDGIERIDLNPVRMEIQTSVKSAPKEETEIMFLTGAKEKVENRQEIEIRASTACRRAVSEGITIQTAAKVDVRPGDIRVESLNFLDETWILDGSRELNGGTDVR